MMLLFKLGAQRGFIELPLQAQGATLQGPGCCYYRHSLRNVEVFGSFGMFLDIFFFNFYQPPLAKRGGAIKRFTDNFLTGAYTHFFVSFFAAEMYTFKHKYYFDSYLGLTHKIQLKKLSDWGLHTFFCVIFCYRNIHF